MRAAACGSKRISGSLWSADCRFITIAPRTRSPRRLRRPGPEAIERELRVLSGLDVDEKVIVLLLGRLTLPIEIGRIVRWHLDAGAAGKDRVLFRPTAA